MYLKRELKGNRVGCCEEEKKQDNKSGNKGPTYADFTLFAVTVSAFSYVVYNALFLAAQLWEAVATLLLGLYYVLLIYGYVKRKKRLFMIGTGLQAVATVVIFGLFVFFFVEIFVSHSLVYKVLTYISQTEESQRVKIARYTSIGMTVDSLVTAALHTWALVMCILECREMDHESDAPFEAMAIHTELDFPEEPRTIPHIVSQSDTGNIPSQSDIVKAKEKATETIIAQLGEERFTLPRLQASSGGGIIGTSRFTTRPDQSGGGMVGTSRFTTRPDQPGGGIVGTSRFTTRPDQYQSMTPPARY